MKNEYLKIKMQALENEIKLNKACSFLKMGMPIFCYKELDRNLKELCLHKVCDVIGIRCQCDLNNCFLNFFSDVMAEAVSQKLNLNITVACAALRFIKYDHMNLINEVQLMLDEEEIEIAFLDAFNFLHKFKHIATRISA